MLRFVLQGVALGVAIVTTGAAFRAYGQGISISSPPGVSQFDLTAAQAAMLAAANASAPGLAPVQSVNSQTGAVTGLETSTHAAATYLTTAGASSIYQTALQVSAAIAAVPSQFVAGFTPSSPGLKATLMSGTPCAAAYSGQYAVVSDLFSGAGTNTNEVMRCGSTGGVYYWRPQRTDFAASVTATGGTITQSCLVSPPTMFLTGTLATSLTIALSTANCWPGARFDIASNLTLGLLSATVTGLFGGASKVIPLNTHYTFVFDGANWQYYQ